MSFRSRRGKNTQAAKAKDTAARSVEDILSQGIHDVTAGEIDASEALLSSSRNQTDRGMDAMAQPNQGTAAEADDLGYNLRNTARRHTPSPSQSLSPGPPRRLRSSLRHSIGPQDSGFQVVHGIDDEGLLDPELRSCHRPEDPPVGEPMEPTTMEPNNVSTSQRNTSPPTNQQLVAEAPSQPRASNISSSWMQDIVEPAEQGDSQARTAMPLKWSDEIGFDEREEVEMRDSNGKRGRKGGKILPRQVWSLQPGVRFVVPFNALDQPIRKGGHVLVRFLGDVAKNGEICPIGDESWFKVDKSVKADIISLAREKFVLPEREAIDKEILKNVSNKWRIYRHRLKARYKRPSKTQEEVASVVPKGVIPSQWLKLVEYWFSDKSQHLSTLGKEARATQLHMHTTGSKSFAQKRDEFEKVHGREPGAVEWFAETHQRKDGTYVEDASKEFLDTAATLIAQHGAPSSPTERVAVENQVFNKLMYLDNDRRPLGYGGGVNKTKVFGVAAELRKRGFPSLGTLAEAESLTRNKIPRFGEETRRSGHLTPDMSAEVERLHFAVTFMGETNELMQAQLRMQSKQLSQSQQLHMQSQQMEGLQFQLQQVTSLLTKFGDMLNRPAPSPMPRGFASYRGVNIPRTQVRPASYEISDGESESSDWDSD